MKPARLIVGVSLACASWFAVPSVAAQEKAGLGNEGQKLRQKVLDARQSLRDGHAEFTTVDPTGRKTRHTAWFKGTQRLRVDAPHRKMLRVKEDLFEWTGTPGGSSPQPVRRELDDPKRDVFDFRLLGTVFDSPTGFRNHELGEFLALDTGNVRPDVQTVELHGREGKLVTTDYPWGMVLRQWIDVERGPSIVGAEAEFDVKGKHYLDRVVSHLRDYEGTWFPEKVVYTRFVNRRLFGASWVTTVEEAEFNTGLQDELFTLTALGVPRGADVQESPPYPEGQRVWDGEKLILKHSDVPQPSDN
jgi:hypothetical protein